MLTLQFVVFLGNIVLSDFLTTHVTRSIRKLVKVFGFLVFGLVLSSCSSSNDGTVLPDRVQDDTAPKLLSISPPESADQIVPTSARFTLEFDELLDFDSIVDNTELLATKGRDIYSLSAIGSSEYVDSVLDQRGLSLSASPQLITVNEQEVVREYTDEDGALQTETRTVTFERLATKLSIIPTNRLSLASNYALRLREGLKDVSPINSVSPIDESQTTGNYIDAKIERFFGTADGSWRVPIDVNLPFHTDSNFVASASFSTTPVVGNIFWLQSSGVAPAPQVTQLYSRTYNQGLQSFDAPGIRFDYMSSIDTAPNVGADEVVTEYATAFSSFAGVSEMDHSSRQCATWINRDSSSPLSSTVYARCSDGQGYSPRVLISNLTGTINDLFIHIVNSEWLVVGFVHNGVVRLHSLAYRTGSLTAESAGSYDLAGRYVHDVASVQQGLSNYAAVADNTSLLLTVEDSSAGLTDKHAIVNLIYELDESGGLSFTTQEVNRGQSMYSSVEFGLSRLGVGFASWLTGVGDLDLYTSVFDTNVWQAAIKAPKVGGGTILSVRHFVFVDGQALYAWVQRAGGLYYLKVQGLLYADGNYSYARPSVYTLTEGAATISNLNVVGDREGNAFVSFDYLGTEHRAVRFLHNYPWLESWSNVERVAVEARAGSARLAPILEDGRMTMLYIDDADAYDALKLIPFSDFD